MKTLTAALSTMLAFSCSAMAQSHLVEIPDRVTVATLGTDVDTIDDWDVFAPDGTKLGDVEEVLGTDPRTPTALAIDFDGNDVFRWLAE